MRLGRKPANRVALAQSPAHRFGAVPAPAVLDRTLVDFLPGIYSNDVYGDCTAVALTNSARGVSFLNGFDLAVDPTKPLAFFADCVGNPPDLASSDGAVAVQVLQRQARDGYDIGPQRLVGNWGTVDVHNRTEMAWTMARLGHAYFGVVLHERDMETTEVWDVQPGRDDGAEVGGHMINGWAYTGLADDSTVWIGTWGRWQAVTWAWLAARLDEAHGLVWRQLSRSDGFYLGVTADGLIVP